MLKGKYDEVEPLYREAIRIGEKILGREHPDVAVWLNNLAGLLNAQVSRKIVQILAPLPSTVFVNIC